MNTENISISDAEYSGQDCYAYVITLSKPMTVREFINELVDGLKEESGMIRIANTDNYYSYAYGETEEYRINREYADTYINFVRGYGGWSMSNFIIFLKE